MKTLSILGLIGLIVLAAAIAVGVMTWSRMPWVKAWRKRRTEKRILGPRYSPPVRTPRRFRTGDMPAHERCVLIPGEAEVFRMITEAEYAPDPRAYGWIGQAVRGRQKAGEQ